MKLNKFATFAISSTWLTVLLLVTPKTSLAYELLQECMALSSENTDIHNCMDNYLDIMDDNISDISEYIVGDLGGDSLTAFQEAQQTFFAYRKANCVWYLSFSKPRSQAELIAKNCLATMSQQRLSELQSLIADRSPGGKGLRGYYVYGASRNSFQPCGNERRYWVEGDNAVVAELQQNYLSKATQDLQLMYVSLTGTLASTDAHSDHAGVVTLTSVIDVRPPNDSDCSLPVGQPASKPTELKPELSIAAKSIEQEPEVVEPIVRVEEPEQVLRAYFGDWFAECEQIKTNYACDVLVALSGDKADADTPPTLKLRRKANKRTTVQLQFPDREVDSPVKIQWRVDGYTFGDIVGSNIRVDEAGTRQLVHERRFVNDDLMPLLIGGGELGIEILADVDDASGDTFKATLKGLTRALAFADDFVNSSGSL